MEQQSNVRKISMPMKPVLELSALQGATWDHLYSRALAEGEKVFPANAKLSVHLEENLQVCSEWAERYNFGQNCEQFFVREASVSATWYEDVIEVQGRPLVLELKKVSAENWAGIMREIRAVGAKAFPTSYLDIEVGCSVRKSASKRSAIDDFDDFDEGNRDTYYVEDVTVRAYDINV